jgi:HEAT repeat protein
VTTWAEGRGEIPSTAIAQLARDPDPRVRIATIQAVARRRPAGCEQLLSRAVSDGDLQVRIAAIAAWGELGGDQAQAVLRQLLTDRGEMVRKAAVSALAASGAEDLVISAKGDPSWRVRLEVAKALAQYSDPQGIAAAGQLLTDPSPAVQQQVVASVGQWPLRQSGPILLETLGKESYQTRRAAAEQLAARWAPATEYPVEGDPRQRAEALARLEGRFRREIGFADPDLLAGAGNPSRRQSDEQVRTEALAEVERLASDDIRVRRRAAERLADLARDRGLERPVMLRLAEAMTREADPLVWRSVLVAVESDGSEPAIRLAYMAIGQSAAEVRRRACEHLAAYPSPSHAKVLLPALEDANPAVAIAAVRAIGAGGGLEDTGPLERLLGSAHQTVRVEAATSLAQLKDPSGAAALERLAYSGDPSIRRQVAMAMGRVGDPTFAPTLVRLLDDQYAIRLAALESLRKVMGGSGAVLESPPSQGTAEQVEFWKRTVRQREAVYSGW